MSAEHSIESIARAIAAMGAGDSPAALSQLEPSEVLVALATGDLRMAMLASTWCTSGPVRSMTGEVAKAIASGLAAACAQVPADQRDAFDRAAGLSYARAALLAPISSGAEVEEAFATARRLSPELGAVPYDFGLWLKTQARFEEALAAFLAARASLTEDEAMSWNLAIAATGAGDGRTASEAWKKLGFEVERGIDSLPRIAGLADVSVRLIGPDSTIEDVWARPQSPVHGVVLSVTSARDLPAGYADMILWDAAPIEELVVGTKKVHRFPLLARLRQSGAKTFAVVGAGDLDAFARAWPDALWLSMTTTPGHGHLVVEPEMSLPEARDEVARSRRAHPDVTFEVPGLVA